MFRVFGHDKVWVLDGGLPQWRASGYDVESSASSDAIVKARAAGEAIEKVYQGQSVICSIIYPFWQYVHFKSQMHSKNLATAVELLDS